VSVLRGAAFALLLGPLLAGVALGAGFSIYEQGAKALGMGGAFAAVADDGSAMFFNPAGIARLDGMQLYAGPSFIIVPARQFAGENPYPGYGDTAETTSDLFYPVNAYFSHRVNERLAWGAFFNSPFGLKVEWADPSAFSGRFLSTKAELVPFFFGGVLAVNLNQQIALAGGPTFAHSTVRLDQHLSRNFIGLDTSPVFDVATVELEASNDVGIGFSIGALIEPDESFRIGFGYRHEIEIDYEGDATFTQIPTGSPTLDPLIAAALPENQTAKTSFKFPTQWSVGFAFTGIDLWTFAFDLGWTGWSSFDRLTVEFADPALALDRPQGWEDALNYRFGADWRMRERLSLRFGGYFDENPQPDRAVSPLLPDSDRVGVSLGLGWEFGEGKYVLDVYNLAVIFEERDTNGASQDDFNGKYQSFADIVGFDLGVRF
jgi:long-chain fatty acid transport protein